MNVRCFVGLPLPKALARRLESAGALIRSVDPTWSGEKWVPAKNLHVTTFFIGPIAPDRLEALTGALEEAVVRCDPFELHVRVVQAVPRPGRAKMLWVSFEDASGRAADLSHAVGEVALAYGSEPDFRSYSPHATLCRARTPRPISATAVDAANEPLSGALSAMSVASATLFASRLTPRGPDYEQLAVWPLRGA